jgi:hypothetical protein
VYTKGRTVELFLNGQKAGRKKTKDCKCIFKVKYEEGTLEAVSFNDAGQELERGCLMSADGKLGLSISPEKETVKPGEVFFVPINICGENGVVECNADETIQVRVEGGTLLGFGSANPRTEESYQAGRFTAYAGRTLAVIRAEQSGEIMITAKSKKLGVAKAQIECQ